MFQPSQPTQTLQPSQTFQPIHNFQQTSTSAPHMAYPSSAGFVSPPFSVSSKWLNVLLVQPAAIGSQCSTPDPTTSSMLEKANKILDEEDSEDDV